MKTMFALLALCALAGPLLAAAQSLPLADFGYPIPFAPDPMPTPPDYSATASNPPESGACPVDTIFCSGHAHLGSASGRAVRVPSP